MTKTSCGTLSAGRCRMAQDTRDTCRPCRTDAAWCVPVGPGESLKIESVQPRGGNTLCRGGDDWLMQLQLGELGNTKVFSKWQTPVFTASLGILLLGINSKRGRYSFHCNMQLTNYFNFCQVSIVICHAINWLWHWWSTACWKGLQPCLFLPGCNLCSDWPCRFGPPQRAERWGLKPTSTRAFNNRCHAVDTWQVATQHFTG